MSPTQPGEKRSRASTETETNAAEETVAAHAKRVMRARIGARVAAMLDRVIASLQALRVRAGGPRPSEDADDRRERGNDRPRGRQEVEAAAPAEAPKPRRRLRAFMTTVVLLLFGALAGAAGAYVVLQKQFENQLSESHRREAVLAQKARPTGEIARAFERAQAQRADAEKKLLTAVAGYTDTTAHTYTQLENLLGQQIAESRRMEATLVEQTRAAAEARKLLAEEQTRRTRSEAALSSAVEQHEKSMREQAQQLKATERQLVRTERQLDKLLGGERVSRAPDRETETRRRRDTSATRAKCTLDGNNVDALKGCIDEFNE